MMNRLRPATLPASYPRVARPTVSAALTLWESMIPALGWPSGWSLLRTVERKGTVVHGFQRRVELQPGIAGQIAAGSD